MTENDRLLTPEAAEKAVADAFAKDALLQHYVESRGQWEKLLPFTNKAQDIKTLKAVGEKLEKNKKWMEEHHSGHWVGTPESTGGRIAITDTYYLIRRADIESLQKGEMPK